jgi:threonylcarbamoyladenosine tRNA methylthiotransferase MtaB
MDKVALETLGCKLNQAETDSLARQLLSKGYQLAESAGEADIYVLNTCTVTHVADRKARHLLRLAHRTNPKALIVAIGCYVQRAPEELRQLGIVNLILDNEQKDRLVDILGNRNLRNKGDRSPVKEYHSSKSPEGSCRLVDRTRSLIKIQEGCHSFCSFCIVPYLRGQERSLPLEKVIQQVKERVAAGHKEVTLTGTKIGAYQWEGENHGSLCRLIEGILDQTGVKRLRLSSLQPQDLTPELIRLWAEERLCPHLHLPLQSGSQAMLQQMKRQYSITDYQRAVSLAREAIPDLAITTDILVGFPGEGEREFEESYRFCEKMSLANIHVFPYSPRLGTAAAWMPHQVAERTKKERSQRMLALAQQSAQRFRGRFLGRTMMVLWEGKSKPGVWSGLTANYLRVFVRSEQELTNCLLPVKLVAQHPQGFLGEPVEDSSS